MLDADKREMLNNTSLKLPSAMYGKSEKCYTRRCLVTTMILIIAILMIILIVIALYLTENHKKSTH